MAFSALLWALQISGHQAPQPAEAQRITQALAETVPTVTRWDVTVQRESSDSVSTYQCKYGPVQRLYVRDGQTYLYTSGTWYRVTANHSHAACSSDLQWAFTVLVNHLQQRDLVAQGKLIDGQPIDQFRYLTPGGRQEQVVSTVWVNRHTGLIVRLQRVTLRGSHVVEREFADYRYDYQRSP
jgi:hypothetical protein